MKRILILTAGFGEGHNAAARGVRDALQRLENVEAVYWDPFAHCHPFFYAIARKSYLAAINHFPAAWETVYAHIDSSHTVQSNLFLLSDIRNHLRKLLATQTYDAILSTYPIYNYLFDQLHAEALIPAIPRVTVVTDSISINSVWHRCHSDVFLVPNAATAEVMRQDGVPADRLHVSGFPVSPRFADLAKNPRSSLAERSTRRVLFMINSAKEHAPALAKTLSARADVELTVTAGRDAALKQALTQAVRAAPNPVEVIGWTDRMPELLTRSDLLIGKAGGATVQEAIAAACPIIISKIVPGQEEGNARLILENECGALQETPEAVLRQIDDALADNARLLNQWQQNIARISQPDAALKIARFVLDVASRAD